MVIFFTARADYRPAVRRRGANRHRASTESVRPHTAAIGADSDTPGEAGRSAIRQDQNVAGIELEEELRSLASRLTAAEPFIKFAQLQLPDLARRLEDRRSRGTSAGSTPAL